MIVDVGQCQRFLISLDAKWLQGAPQDDGFVEPMLHVQLPSSRLRLILWSDKKISAYTHVTALMLFVVMMASLSPSLSLSLSLSLFSLSLSLSLSLSGLHVTIII